MCDIQLKRWESCLRQSLKNLRGTTLKMWEGQEHLDELIEDLEVEMEILKFESDIIGMEGLRSSHKRGANLNDHLGINVRRHLEDLPCLACTNS